MLINLLFLVGLSLVIVSYGRIFISYFRNRKNIENDLTGFDVAKEITFNYDEINIVESKKIIFSQYHIKRGIIRFIPQDYEGKNLFSYTIAAQLSGYSLGMIENNYYFKMISKIFPVIDWVNKSGVIATIICFFTKTINDAKIGVILLILVLIYQYFILQMNEIVRGYLDKYLEKYGINKVLDGFYLCHKGLFVATLFYILKEIVMILGL